MPPHARRVDHDAHARGEVGVHLRLHALDQVVVAEGLDVSERVDTVGGQVLRGMRRVEHARWNTTWRFLFLLRA